MTRMFLIGSMLVCFFGSTAQCDTLFDVFDESVESKLMYDNAKEIEVSIEGYYTEVEVKPDQASPRSMFFLAASKKRITKSLAPEFWSPGKYPAGLLDGDPIIAANKDEHFFYLAADLEDRVKEIQGFYLNDLENRVSNDQSLSAIKKQKR